MSESSTSDASTPDAEPRGEAPPAKAPFTERLSDALQSGIKVVTGANGKPPRRLKTLLSGTWLGHPLHPAITDVPVAAWLGAAVFDVLWLAVPDATAWAPRGAQALVVVGLIGALGAFATGIADWSDTYGAERTVGLYHGLLNTSAIVLYAISTALRFTESSGQSVVGAILGFVGLAAVLVAAFLGGDMVFAKGTGVNHTAWEAGGEEYEAVLPVAEAKENALYRVTVGGVPVLLVKLNDTYAAISATCSHAGGPLDEGTLAGGIVQCPWHGSRFRLRDGKAVTGPATVNQPRYDVRVRDGQIEVRRVGGH
jgi:nitrite reductase/ring-hydroxylating ferredoxin subunit/uncharacterized membrane protein